MFATVFGAADADRSEPAAATVAYLWPCNVSAWRHWCEVQTEYRSSGMGAGMWLDYGGVRAYMDEIGLQGDERRDVWAGIRAADAATRQVWAEQAKERQAREK